MFTRRTLGLLAALLLTAGLGVATGRQARAATSPGLTAGQPLVAGQVLYSADRAYRLVMQGDGNLVVYTSSGQPVWSSRTQATGAYALLQTDGELVVNSSANQALWWSGSSGAGPVANLGDDGQIVVSSGGRALWSSASGSTGIVASTLDTGQVLTGGQALASADGSYRAVMQRDGNIVVYDAGGHAIWSSRTQSPGASVVMQRDGNLVLYSAARKAAWADGVFGSAARLVMQADGNLVEYSNGNALWASKYSRVLAPSQTPAAPWWSGSCDAGNNPGSHALGTSYKGVATCGGGAARTVRFFDGAWGEYEWQCVELSMRYLYLVDGVHPYGANGGSVVANYTAADGGGLVAIANGTAGKAPLPGDVLSQDNNDAFGHTGVVIAATVDMAGNGVVTTMDENSAVSGQQTYPVSNWDVGFGVTGWLHKP